ncbi:MAG: hypothetical protein AB1453_08320 [Chloroflexota bacterium]|jgi:hypothetical protein
MWQEIVLNSPGMGIGKMRRMLSGYKIKAGGADMTSARCNEKWTRLSVAVAEINKMLLSINELSGEDAEQLHAWLSPITDGEQGFVNNS